MQQLHLFGSFLCCQHIVWGILGKTSSIVQPYNACRCEPGAMSASLALTEFGKRRCGQHVTALQLEGEDSVL